MKLGAAISRQQTWSDRERLWRGIQGEEEQPGRTLADEQTAWR